jgi:hypothetical protein
MAMTPVAIGVDVPTMEEFNALQDHVDNLEARITKLETGTAPPPDPQTPSKDGTTVTDTTGQIVDVQHRVFKLVGDPANYTITRDGAPSPSDRVAQLYAKSGVCYQQNQDHDWWAMPGNDWLSATDPSVTTPPPNPTPGTGPDAQSTFLRIDFAVPQTYKGKANQQVVDRLMWGVSTGGAADNSYSVFSNPAFQAAAAKINPGLWRINGNIPERDDSRYFNSDMSVKTATFDQLINNWSKVDPLGISKLIVGCNFTTAGNDLNRYRQGMTNLARFLSGTKLPIIGFEAQNEPDDATKFDDSLLVSIYNAMVDGVKSVNNKLLVSGPVTAWAGSREPYFHNNAKQVDIYNYHVYVGGYPDVPKPPYNMSRGSSDIATVSKQLRAETTAILLGEYNIDWNCQAPDQHGVNGAVYDATMLMQCLDASPVPFYAAIWDAFGDGTCGVITDPDMHVVSGGLFLGQGVRTLFGPRWRVTSNSNSLLVCACTPAPGHCSALIVNAGRGNQNGPLALAHWPSSSSGDGTVNLWQMRADNAVGLPWTAQVSKGLVNLVLPDPSITFVTTMGV